MNIQKAIDKLDEIYGTNPRCDSVVFDVDLKKILLSLQEPEDNKTEIIQCRKCGCKMEKEGDTFFYVCEKCYEPSSVSGCKQPKHDTGRDDAGMKCEVCGNDKWKPTNIFNYICCKVCGRNQEIKFGGEPKPTHTPEVDKKIVYEQWINGAFVYSDSPVCIDYERSSINNTSSQQITEKPSVEKCDTWTDEEIAEHIKTNVKDYSAGVVVAALYKKLYGVYPKIGLSGAQAELAETIVEKLPMSVEDKEIDLHHCLDATIWAKEFMRLHKKFGYEPDEETMRGWFANSIMAGYDSANRKLALSKEGK